MPSCRTFLEDLVECLLKSPCVVEQGHSVRECMRKENDAGVPDDCRAKQRSYATCKSNLWNMSRRFRGSFGTDYNELRQAQQEPHFDPPPTPPEA